MTKATAKASAAATPLVEAARAASLALAQANLERAKAVAEIFARPEMAQAQADLEALHDAEVPTSGMSAATDVNRLIKSALTLFTQTPVHAAEHVATLEATVNPPPPAAPVEPSRPAPAE